MAAIQPPAPADIDEDVDLDSFVKNLERVLQVALQRPALFAPYNERLRAAWTEVEPRFADIRAALGQADEVSLTAHGLAGEQLKLKLAVTTGMRHEFEKALRRADRRIIGRLLYGPVAEVVPLAEPGAQPPADLDRPSRWRKMDPRQLARRAVKTKVWHWMQVADEVLGSVAIAIPPAAVAASAAGEFRAPWRPSLPPTSPSERSAHPVLRRQRAARRTACHSSSTTLARRRRGL
jgi:hypothetical protein